MTPDKATLKSIVSLKNNPDFKAILDWIKKEHFSTAIASTKIQGQPGDWVSGQAQAIEMLLNRFETAEKRLKAIKDSKNEEKGMVL